MMDVQGLVSVSKQPPHTRLVLRQSTWNINDLNEKKSKDKKKCVCRGDNCLFFIYFLLCCYTKEVEN